MLGEARIQFYVIFNKTEDNIPIKSVLKINFHAQGLLQTYIKLQRHTTNITPMSSEQSYFTKRQNQHGKCCDETTNN